MHFPHTDPSGLVLGPRIHDGHLQALHFIDGAKLEFVVGRVDHSVVSIRLEGLISVGIRNITNGAGVAHLFAWPMAAVPVYRPECNDGPWNTLLGASLRPGDAAPMVEEIVKRHPTAIFVQLQCSIEGAVSALCESLTFEDVSR